MAIYSERTIARINKAQLKEEILNSIAASPQMRREISRVFQQANRRIQNIRRGGYFSPALLALGRINEKYTVFSTRQTEWNSLKREYARAVAFLNAPTSTAEGAREYEGAIKAKFNLTDETFSAMKRSLGEKITSVAALDFVQSQLWGDSKGVAREFKQSAESASGQLERDSVQFVNAVDDEINRTANEGATVMGEIQDSVERLQRTIEDKMKGLRIL